MTKSYGGGSGAVAESRYVTIAQTLAEEIAANTTEEPGPRRLPSERNLAERFDCQRPTIREALHLLAGRGLIYRKDRSGWYVSPPRLHYNPTMPVPLKEITESQDRELHTEVLTTDPEGQPEASVPTAKFLALRRRSLDGLPVLVERIYMQQRYRKQLLDKDLTTSISHLLQHDLGARITHEQLTLNSTAMVPDVAALLGSRTGAPIFEIERVRFDGDQLLSIDVEFWKPEAIHVTLETDWVND
ncbi:MAG: UTRA domain-containing protein [Acidimicrobiia bacterium]|nr:UTRA domain-containing protein [Acidimicrobiia bacterium]